MTVYQDEVGSIRLPNKLRLREELIGGDGLEGWLPKRVRRGGMKMRLSR